MQKFRESGSRLLNLSTHAFLGIAVILFILQAQAVFIKIQGNSLSVYALVLGVVFLFFALLGQMVILFSRVNTSSDTLAAPFRGMLVLSPLIALAVFATVWLVVEWRIEGAQNLLALYVLVIGSFIFGFADVRVQEQTVMTLLSALTTIVSLVFVAFRFLNIEYFADRQFAMIALVGLAAAVAIPRNNWVTRANPYLIFLAVVVSGSRTATLLALVMLLFIHSKSGASVWVQIGRRIFTLVASGVAIALTYLTRNLLTVREVERGAEGTASEILTNSNGRFSAWAEFIGLLKSPTDWIVGIGTGGAMEFGTANLPFFSHPHNEYIRYLVDLGIIGLLLLAVGSIILLVTLLKDRGLQYAAPKAGFLVMMALAGMSLTDGPLYSSFVVIPAIVVVGLGLRRSEKGLQTGLP